MERRRSAGRVETFFDVSAVLLKAVGFVGVKVEKNYVFDGPREVRAAMR